MICPNCGKEYNEKMTCCISCGASLVPYEHDTEQTTFETVLPEAVPGPEYSEDSSVIREYREKAPDDPDVNKKDENENIPADTVPQKTKKGTTPVSRAAKNIGSFAAAAVMFILTILSAASFSVRLMTDSKKISEFADDLDVMNLPAAQTWIGSSENYDIAPDATVQEAIFVMSNGTGLTKEDIREIYENSTANDFLASQLNGYADFIREGELPERLTAEKLKAVFSENIGLISDAIGKPLSQHNIDLAFSELDSTENILEAISPSELENVIGGSALTAFRLFSSLPVMMIEACAAAAMLIILRAINGKTEKVLGWGGGALLMSGAAVLTAAFLCSVQVFFIDQDRFVRSIIKCVTDVINPDIYRLGGILSIIGAVMLLWSATLKKYRSAKQ